MTIQQQEQQLQYAARHFELAEIFVGKLLNAIQKYIELSAKFSHVKPKDKAKVKKRKVEIEAWIEYYRRQAVATNQYHPVLKLQYGSAYLNQMSHMHMNIIWLRQLLKEAEKLT